MPGCKKKRLEHRIRTPLGFMWRFTNKAYNYICKQNDHQVVSMKVKLYENKKRLCHTHAYIYITEMD